MAKKGTITTSGGIMQKLDFPFSFLNYLILDTRSLSLFRILLGISILYNIIFIKWKFIGYLLGENAFITLELIQTFTNVPDYSIFDLYNTSFFVKVFMVLYLINTVLFTIGFKTKLTSILSVFFQFNLFQALNPVTLGPDMYNFHLSFWAMFLPLGNYFSIDRVLFKNSILRAPSLAVSIVLLFQIGCIYFFTAVFKYGDPWVSGYAVRNMLLDENFTRWLGEIFRDSKPFYSSMTYLTLFFEYLTLPLLFVKWRFKYFRVIISLFLLFFHGTIFLTYDVGNFSISGIAIAFLILPTDVWDRIGFLKKSKIISPQYNLMNWNIKPLVLIFSMLCIYVILERNIYNYYYYIQDNNTSEKLQKFQIPSPAVASIFTQYWRMFAPEPQNHIGWFEICLSEPIKDSKEHFSCDVIFHSLRDKNKISDWEAFLISVSKNKLSPNNEDNILFRYFSKWLLWKILKINSDKKAIFLDEFYLIEHRVLCGDQSNPHKPQKTRHIYNVLDLTDGKVIEIN